MTAASSVLERTDANIHDLRTISPRRGLPNGRALLGALLISIAAVGAYTAATRGSGAPGTRYLVVTSAVAAGQPVRLDDVAFETMDIPADVARSALGSAVGLDAATALRDLRPGEILSIDDLLAAPVLDGVPIGAVHELSIPVPLDRTPGDLVRGDRVTVLSTLRIGDTPTTVVALEDAVVVAFDSKSDQLGSTGTGVLTLAIPDADAVVSTAHFAQQGDLTIVRSTRAIGDTFPDSYAIGQRRPIAPVIGP